MKVGCMKGLKLSVQLAITTAAPGRAELADVGQCCCNELSWLLEEKSMSSRDKCLSRHIQSHSGDLQHSFAVLT